MRLSGVDCNVIRPVFQSLGPAVGYNAWGLSENQTDVTLVTLSQPLNHSCSPENNNWRQLFISKCVVFLSSFIVYSPAALLSAAIIYFHSALVITTIHILPLAGVVNSRHNTSASWASKNATCLIERKSWTLQSTQKLKLAYTASIILLKSLQKLQLNIQKVTNDVYDTNS